MITEVAGQLPDRQGDPRDPLPVKCGAPPRPTTANALNNTENSQQCWSHQSQSEQLTIGLSHDLTDTEADLTDTEARCGESR